MNSVGVRDQSFRQVKLQSCLTWNSSKSSGSFYNRLHVDGVNKHIDQSTFPLAVPVNGTRRSLPKRLSSPVNGSSVDRGSISLGTMVLYPPYLALLTDFTAQLQENESSGGVIYIRCSY